MRILGLLLLLLTVSSCKKHAENYPAKQLSVIDSVSVYIGLPTVMKYYDHKIFIVDMFDEEELVKIIDPIKKELLFSFASKGEGPNEYLHIGDVDLYTGKDNRLKISLYDPMASRIGIYDYDSLLSKKEEYIPTTLHFSEEGIRLHELLKINEGYIATGITLEGKYTVLSDSLEVQSFYGSYRPKPMNSIPDMSHVIANYGKTVLSDNRDLLVEIIYNASVLSCFDIKKKQIIKKWEHVIHELDYKMEGESVVNNASMGYLSAHIGKKNIYALYSGEPDNMSDIAPYGKEVHVYNKENGHTVERYSISRPAFALTIDEKKHKLYALVHTPEPNILIYNLPNHE